eukprot:4311498-Prorocentrum_lima.AAC.1
MGQSVTQAEEDANITSPQMRTNETQDGEEKNPDYKIDWEMKHDEDPNQTPDTDADKDGNHK